MQFSINLYDSVERIEANHLDLSQEDQEQEKSRNFSTSSNQEIQDIA
jgi:hypothetical protein